MFKALIAASAALLVGCQATAPQQKTAADDPSLICFGSLTSNPDLQSLVPKIGAINRAADVSLDMRSNTDKPTDAEKAAINKLATLRQGCYEMGRDFRNRYAPPSYMALAEEGHARGITLLANLYAGQINYGQYVTGRAELAAAMNIKQANAREQAAQVNQQAVAAQRVQAAAELNNALMLLQMSRPAPVQPMNNNISCTSQNLNGTVHTNCR